jgi:hypothetical protein
MTTLKEHSLLQPNDFFVPGCLYRWTWNQNLKQFNDGRQPFGFLFIEAAFGSNIEDAEQIASVVFSSTNKGKTFLHPKLNSIFLCTNVERKQAKKSSSFMWKITFLFEELVVFDILFDEKIWDGRWSKIV